MSSVLLDPWRGAMMGDAEIAAFWSVDAQLAHYLAFEAAYARALGAVGLVEPAHAEAAAAAIESAEITPEDLSAETAVDGVPIPALVRRLKARAGAAADAVHQGATSQDVIDTALAITSQKTTELLQDRLVAIEATLANLGARFGALPMMARTRMQDALEITVQDRIGIWIRGLGDARAALARAGAALSVVQLGGPVGDRRAWPDHAAEITSELAAALELGVSDAPWHTARGRVVEFGGALALLLGALGKMGQDIALMAQGGAQDVQLEGGGASSAMPHKVNPVEAELLVSLARYGAAQIGGLHQALVHEQERSGAAWTLESLILPDLAIAAGGATNAALRLLGKITRLGPQIDRADEDATADPPG